MKRIAALAILAGLFAWPSAGQAQPITIKLKERREGDVALVKRNETTASKVVVTDGMGQVIADQRELKTEVLEYTEAILKREPGKQATKLQRDYTAAKIGKDDKVEDGPLLGKSVIIEKKGDAYVFTEKGGANLAGQAVAALAKDFTKNTDTEAKLEKLVLPNKAVKPGDIWKIDMAKIAAELAKQATMELDGDKASGQGTLVKAYKKNGAQFGEMKFRLEMPVLTIGKGKEQLKCAAGAKVVMNLTMDACLDGTSADSTLKMKMLMTGSASVPQAPGTLVTLDVTMDASQAQQEVRKK